MAAWPRRNHSLRGHKGRLQPWGLGVLPFIRRDLDLQTGS